MFGLTLTNWFWVIAFTLFNTLLMQQGLTTAGIFEPGAWLWITLVAIFLPMKFLVAKWLVANREHVAKLTNNEVVAVMLATAVGSVVGNIILIRFGIMPRSPDGAWMLLAQVAVWGCVTWFCLKFVLTKFHNKGWDIS